MTNLHVMLDLETLGVDPGDIILSIGAVKFDPYGTGVASRFHVGIDAESAESYGLKARAGTTMWWMDAEREDARHQLMALEKVDIATALEGFAIWFGGESLPIWGNGATMDNMMLIAAYKAVGLNHPWTFRDDRCYRTLKGVAKHIKLERVGTLHNGVDDAESQALHMQQIVQQMHLVV